MAPDSAMRPASSRVMPPPLLLPHRRPQRLPVDDSDFVLAAGLADRILVGVTALFSLGPALAAGLSLDDLVGRVAVTASVGLVVLALFVICIAPECLKREETQEEPQDCDDRHTIVHVAYPAAGNAGDDWCCICLEQMRRGAGRLLLPCGHAFHARCIRTWWRQSAKASFARRCPLCRQPSFVKQILTVCADEADAAV
mmetsp:Transcript_46596/g.92316  ORF Transcript_46596/g.92316 Transcript_46596/m.92316 type:complete len:198 (-) Transcript_46596:399-992(-)